MTLCAKDRKELIDRINRLEGQIRGLSKMVQNDRDCFAVLKQVAAAKGAIQAIGMTILKDHLQGCVTKAIRADAPADQMIDQALDILNKFGR